MPKVLCLLLCLTCISQARTRESSPTPAPAGVKFKIEMNTIRQRQFADTIATKLYTRLQAYSSERGDYVLVADEDSADYVFTIRVDRLIIVPFGAQDRKASTRQAVVRKYDAMHDSAEATVPERSVGKTVAANVVANVVANALLIPMGIVAIIAIGEDHVPEPTPAERQVLSRSYSTASVRYTAVLTTKNAKKVWSKESQQKYLLQNVTHEANQISILARDLLLELDGKMPLFQLKRRKFLR